MYSNFQPSTRGNRDLLLTGLAVYHNEENLQKYADIIIPENTQLYSSDIAQQMVWRWGRKTVSVDVSWDNKWTLEKWHVVAAFRKYKYVIFYYILGSGALFGKMLDLGLLKTSLGDAFIPFLVPAGGTTLRALILIFWGKPNLCLKHNFFLSKLAQSEIEQSMKKIFKSILWIYTEEFKKCWFSVFYRGTL